MKNVVGHLTAISFTTLLDVIIGTKWLSVCCSFLFQRFELPPCYSAHCQ